MQYVRNGLRPAFALFVIAHGLAHTVLPISGWMQPEALGRDFVPLVLYGVAILGFILAGLGVLGVRPLTGATRPLMVVASAYSLVFLWRVGDGAFWLGAVVDGVLFVAGLTAAYNRLPAPHHQESRIRT
jgi:hypothetical protein